MMQEEMVMMEAKFKDLELKHQVIFQPFAIPSSRVNDFESKYQIHFNSTEEMQPCASVPFRAIHFSVH